MELGRRDFVVGTNVFGLTKKILEGATMQLVIAFQKLLKKGHAEPLVNVLKVRTVRHRYNFLFSFILFPPFIIWFTLSLACSSQHFSLYMAGSMLSDIRPNNLGIDVEPFR